jgi:hypothetical protein
MKIVKLNDLTLPQLNFAVAVCEGYITAEGVLLPAADLMFDVKTADALAQKFRPSMDWEHGGPIIERDGITVGPHTTSPFIAHYGPSVITQPWRNRSVGSTHLVAAMRCYVESKLGTEIDIPDHLPDQT